MKSMLKEKAEQHLSKKRAKCYERDIGNGENWSEHKALFFLPAVTYGKRKVEQKSAERRKCGCEEYQRKSRVHGGERAENHIAPAKCATCKKSCQHIYNCRAHRRHKWVPQAEQFESRTERVGVKYIENNERNRS